MRRIIGIDPGKTGGISCLDFESDGGGLRSTMRASAVKMPATEKGVSEHLQRLKDSAGSVDVYAFIELVHAMPATREERDPEAVRRLTLEITKGTFNPRVAEILSRAGVGVTMKVMQGSVGTFTFGQGYGFLRGCLCALEIRFEAVRPQDWQQVVGCRTRGDKNVSKRRAIELFPTLEKKITHATADALLIAECGKRIAVTDRRPEF